MLHTTRTFFVEKVVPSYSKFVEYYNNRVFGLNTDTFNAGEVAGSLLDIPEHLFTEFGTTFAPNHKELRAQIISIENAYKIVCDLGNVIKHREICFNSPSFRSLNCVKEFIGITRFEDDQGYFYKSRKILEVTLDDGRIVEIGGIIKKSVNVWANYLVTRKIIPAVPTLPDLLPWVTTRQDLRFEGEFTIRGFVGEYMEVKPKFVIHRNDTNELSEIIPGDEFETMDLNYRFEIAESPFS